ncbi:hypothetical protein PO909_033700 [Leuciscus waleckii]
MWETSWSTRERWKTPPTLPPSRPHCPAPSSKISQFLILAFAGSPQPQIPPVEGIPHCSHHSTLARHPDSSALVPPSLSSTWDYQTYSHWAPSILRLHLSWTSPRLRHGLASRPLRSVSLHPSGSALPPAPPRPSVALAPPQPSGTLVPPRWVVAMALSRLPKPAVSFWSICSPSTLWAPSPLALSPSVIPMA